MGHPVDKARLESSEHGTATTEITTNDRIEFGELPVIVGRDSTADIRLDDPTLPPYQCMIDERADDGAVVWNLRNDSPLYVNGRRVTKAELFHGDILTIGQNRFVFFDEAALHRPKRFFSACSVEAGALEDNPE